MSGGDFLSRDRPDMGRRDGTGHDTSEIRARVGIVHELDLDSRGAVQTARVRVVFPSRDEIVSWWLFVLQFKTHLDKHFWMPDLGEQVLCIMDNHDEEGYVLGAIYSTVDTLPGAPVFSAGAPTGPFVGTFDSAFAAHANDCAAVTANGGAKLLKAIAISESSLDPTAMSLPGFDGSRSWGLMQINTNSHPGYSPDELKSNVDLNVSLGAADFCAKYAATGNVNDALARYKGWSGGYNDPRPGAKREVDRVLNILALL